MVRWDSVGRDRPGDLASSNDLLVKGSELLDQVLHESSDADLLVLATWNDLGEGTGIHRNYDYWSSGSWAFAGAFHEKNPCLAEHGAAENPCHWLKPSYATTHPWATRRR